MAQIQYLKERLLIKAQLQASPCHYGRMSYYREWSTDKMEKVIEAVHKGTRSVQWAAKVYGIPKSTLHDRILGSYLRCNQWTKTILDSYRAD